MNQNEKQRPATGNGNKLVDEAKQVASTATDKAREQATQKLGSQKDRAGEAVGEVANAVRKAGEGLPGGKLPDLADRAADGIEGVAEYLKSRNVGDLLGEVERFARREPAVFLGVSFAVGLLGGRFLKSSASRPQNADYGYSGGSYGRDFSSDRDYSTGRNFGTSGYESPAAYRPGANQSMNTTGSAGVRSTPTPLATSAGVGGTGTGTGMGTTGTGMGSGTTGTGSTGSTGSTGIGTSTGIGGMEGRDRGPGRA